MTDLSAHPPPLQVVCELAFPTRHRGSVSGPAERLQRGHSWTPSQSLWREGTGGKVENLWQISSSHTQKQNNLFPCSKTDHTTVYPTLMLFLSSWSCVAWVRSTSQTGSPTRAWSTAPPTATLSSGFGKQWSRSMRRGGPDYCSLSLAHPESHYKASRLCRVCVCLSVCVFQLDLNRLQRPSTGLTFVLISFSDHRSIPP